MNCFSPQRAEILAALQTDILRLQGFKTASSAVADLGLGPMAQAFPNGAFPLGCVHEFLSSAAETVAATSGFVAGLLSPLMTGGGAALWISAGRTLFPPALSSFGLQPDRFIFVDLQREKEVMWAMDEALKCGALAAVVGELHELSFTASRRLQLAVEQSGVTGFVLRRQVRQLNTTACVSRWKITPLASEVVDGLPGLCFPQWRVELLRMRNGRTGTWDIQWREGRFEPVYKPVALVQDQHQKAG